MKKILFTLFFLILLYAPFLVVKSVSDYYEHHEKIAKKYECYPVETCRTDFNDDGKPDVFKIVDEPDKEFLHFYRLKIFVEESDRPKEILNIPYDSTDNTYRTHVAVAQFFGRKELIVYDTISNEQFFYWNGERLASIRIGETDTFDERAVYEQEIRRAMSINDDTGGFDLKIMILSTFKLFFGLYYFVLFAGVGLFFYSNKQKSECGLR